MSTATVSPAAGAPAAPDAAAPDARAGKYLTFFLGDEEYGVAILQVQEIIGMQPVTRVPRTPAFLRGVINLRGKVIPVVDLRARFGLPTADAARAGGASHESAATDAVRCIVVVQVALGGAGRRTPVGVVVDRVSEVAAVAGADVEDAPAFGAGVRTEYLLGVATTRPAESGAHGRIRLLLDIDRVLSTEELDQLPAAAPDAA